MLTPILATKLFFPQVRSAFVPRPRLLARLQEGLQGGLTLVSAPAGSGKTSLFSEWRVGPGAAYRAAWVSLDAGDNDLGRFLHLCASSLDALLPGLLAEIQPLLGSPEARHLENVLTPLINTLSQKPGDMLLVLDDYHVIEALPVHQALAFMLDHRPPNLHLALLTRSDPPLPLSRLRAQGHLVEIRAADLRFNEEEAAGFLNHVMGLGLTSEQVSALEKRTEGWIAGLQLAALSMQGREDVGGFIAAFSGSHQYIMDFLAEEVLNRQPKALRDFLLKTSILERFCGPLCDAITNQTDGQEMLIRLAQSNLFLIPLDHERHWFRFHHLFADLLRNRLQQTSEPKNITQLHQQAAVWFAQNGLLFDALKYALAGEDFERAASLLGNHFVAIASAHQLPQFIQWMKDIPESVISAHPRFCILKAYVMAAQGKHAEVEHYILLAEQSLEGLLRSGRLSSQSPDYTAILAEIRSNQAGIAVVQKDFAAALSAAEEALTLVPGDAGFVRSHTLLNLAYAYREMGKFKEAVEACKQALPIAKAARHAGIIADAFAGISRYLKIQGYLQEAVDIQQEALDYVESQGISRVSVCAPLFYGMADLLFELDRLQEARDVLQVGIEISQRGGRSIETIAGLIQLARIQIASGALNQALETLTQCLMEEQQSGVQQHHKEVMYYRSCVLAAFGDSTEAAKWIRTGDLSIADSLGYDQGRHAFARAQLLIIIGSIEEALEILPKIASIAHAQGCLAWQIEALVMLAAAFYSKGQLGHAQNVVKEALALAEPEGFMRVFLDRGEPIRELLKTQVSDLKNGTTIPYSHKLLAAFGTAQNHPPLTKQPLISPLSKREEELLRWIAAGYTNKQIAAELVISIGTVKRHTVNIFTKLDVKNRTAAVAKARELKLL